jgi:hypothetical protein
MSARNPGRMRSVSACDSSSLGRGIAAISANSSSRFALPFRRILRPSYDRAGRWPVSGWRQAPFGTALRRDGYWSLRCRCRHHSGLAATNRGDAHGLAQAIKHQAAPAQFLYGMTQLPVLDNVGDDLGQLGERSMVAEVSRDQLVHYLRHAAVQGQHPVK